MANSTLFRSSKEVIEPTTRNAAGGVAYQLDPERALIQYAMTGTLRNTFYVDAKSHLETVLRLCNSVDNEKIARIAVIARKFGYMKDMPAMLLAYLNAKSPKLLSKVFNQVIDNGKMLKNFVQIVRSGVTGRRGFGTLTKETIRKWFDSRDDVQLLYDSIGGSKDCNVSLDQVLRMVHPRPESVQRSAMYCWLRGGKVVGDKLEQTVSYPVAWDENKKPTEFKSEVRYHELSNLPLRIQQLELYLANPGNYKEPPKVPYRLLTRLKLDKAAWEKIAKDMSWQELRQNLETLTRQGVFENPQMVDWACQKLRDPEEIAKAKVFPYQLLAAYLDIGPFPTGEGVTEYFWRAVANYSEQNKKGSEAVTIAKELRYALQDAMEVAIQNVPVLPGTSCLMVDVSGSMGFAVTGNHHDVRSVKSKVRCVDAAGLMAAAFLRRNPTARVMPFNTQVLKINLNPMDRVMVNAEKFAKFGQGGTNCSEPMRVLNAEKAMVDTVIFLSDNESWADKSDKGTALMEQWRTIKKRNPNAKLICIDITPKENTQLVDSPDMLLIGGFSDQVFTMVQQFVSGQFAQSHWKDLIDSVKIA